MNPPAKSDVIALLTRVRADQARLHELFSVLSGARQFAGQCQRDITNLPRPAPTDEGAILKVITAERQLARAQENIADTEKTIREKCVEIRQYLDSASGGRLVQCLLWAAYIEKRNTVAAALKPFCRDAAEADAVAEQTSAARAWRAQVDAFAAIHNGLLGDDAPTAVLEILEKVEAPCAESMRAAPDLTQFLNWSTPTHW